MIVETLQKPFFLAITQSLEPFFFIRAIFSSVEIESNHWVLSLVNLVAVQSIILAQEDFFLLQMRNFFTSYHS